MHPCASAQRRRFGCRNSGLRHFFEVFIAPLRLRRGQGAMQGNPCYARLFADLTRMSPNPIKASGGCGPRTPGGFSTDCAPPPSGGALFDFVSGCLGFGVFLIDNAGAYAIMIFEEDCGMNGPALAPPLHRREELPLAVRAPCRASCLPPRDRKGLHPVSCALSGSFPNRVGPRTWFVRPWRCQGRFLL